MKYINDLELYSNAELEISHLAIDASHRMRGQRFAFHILEDDNRKRFYLYSWPEEEEFTDDLKVIRHCIKVSFKEGKK